MRLTCFRKYSTKVVTWCQVKTSITKSGVSVRSNIVEDSRSHMASGIDKRVIVSGNIAQEMLMYAGDQKGKIDLFLATVYRQCHMKCPNPSIL